MEDERRAEIDLRDPASRAGCLFGAVLGLAIFGLGAYLTLQAFGVLP